ncbi:MAG: hypothetical protein Q7R97_03595 [Candidatus Daviesbacteria bacterium]|nr:hypothetical protein [Candidatus Daviesbacteria bacterium]
MRLREMILGKSVKIVPVKLPDNGESMEDTIIISAPDVHLVEISLIKNIKGANPSSDYNIAEKVLDLCRNTGIQIEKILPIHLEKIGYKVDKFSFTTAFTNFRDLEGGVLIGEDKAVSFSTMKDWEVANITNQIGSGENANPDSKELIRLTQELQGYKWSIVSSEKVPNKGLRYVIIAKEKIEEITEPVSVSPFLQAPAVWKN